MRLPFDPALAIEGLDGTLTFPGWDLDREAFAALGGEDDAADLVMSARAVWARGQVSLDELVEGLISAAHLVDEDRESWETPRASHTALSILEDEHAPAPAPAA